MKWHDQVVLCGSFWAYSCKVCGALVVVGSARTKHEEYHAERGDYNGDNLSIGELK